MKYSVLKLACVVAIAAASAARAGLPEPDAVLYGTITLDGKAVTAADDLTVIARVDGVPNPVGTYHMGDNPSAGDQYVLRIRVESLADGSAQSNDAALIGQTAHIFVQAGRGAEKSATDFVIATRGITEQRNLVASTGNDCNGNGIADSLDISSGRSKDCNNNGIPDECDSLSALTGPDCGGHGGGGGGSMSTLTTSVVSQHGTIKCDPGGGAYPPGTIVSLTATPDAGFQVKAWTGTDNDGSKEQTNTVTMTASKTVTVEFEPIPLNASASADPSSIIAGQSVRLHGSASGGLTPYTFAWTPVESLSAADVADPTASPASTTSYTLTVTDALSQTAQAAVTVSVTAPPSNPETGEPIPPSEQDTGAPARPAFPFCGTGIAEAMTASLVGLGLMRASRRRGA